MTCKKTFTCDLCGKMILGDVHGIAIRHYFTDQIKAEYIHDERCGRHLCNFCVAGLRSMFEDLDREAKILADIAAEGAAEVGAEAR